MDYTLQVQERDTDGMLWAEVAELPGCFASGKNVHELLDAAAEAITLYMQTPSEPAVVSLAHRRPHHRGRDYEVSEVRLREVCEA